MSQRLSHSRIQHSAPIPTFDSELHRRHSRMVYESSYDSGRKPFQPDLTRGYWAAPSDFIYATVGLAFRLDIFSMTWFLFTKMGSGAIVPYVFCLFLFVVPIFVIQSFLGQFSSTGFISAFRISPIFKGMGYISLAVNVAILTYYSVFAAVPLLFLFHSLRPTLPWSCDGMHHWFQNLTDKEIAHFCNLTDIDALNDTEADMNSTEYFKYIAYQVPSTLFFNSRFNEAEMDEYDQAPFFISWEMVLCTLLTWAIIAAVFYKCFSTEKLGKLLRYGIWTTLALLLVCVIRFSFLPIGLERLREFFIPTAQEFFYDVPTVVVCILSAFGAGWGSIIALASFNTFKTNIMGYSWIICLCQLGIFCAFGFLSNMIECYFSDVTDKFNEVENVYTYVRHHWVLYLSSGSVIAHMEWANMWSILFYGMLTVAALITMITSIFSLLQSTFDEFEVLRSRRTEVTFGVIAFLTLCSLYTCSNHGVIYFSTLSLDSLFTQTALNLLLLLVVLWIYGRERFQRDIEFMLSQRFSTCKVNMLRFVAPLCLLLILIFSVVAAFYQHTFTTIVMQVAALFLIVLPWLYIPGYMIFIMLQTSGPLKVRFKRCCRPMDWYPVELEERQRYEEAMGNMDITHQLNPIDDELVS